MASRAQEHRGAGTDAAAARGDQPVALSPADARALGLDLEAVTAWMGRQGIATPARLGARRLHGGRSNLTFELFGDDGFRCVLRRPPLGTLLPTAHDMGREWRFLAALWPTGFPVPRPLAHCADEAVIGAPYYVMELVDGVVVGDEADAAALSPEARHAASINLVRTMAALHRFDAHALSLGDPAKADTHLTRQLHRWKAQVDAVADPCGGVEIARSYARLSSAAPDLAVPGVVHGDFRLGNALIEPSTGAIQAILDWEIATVGNVLIDIGWLVASWHGPDRIDADTPESLRGFPPRADVARLYAELMDLDPEALSYFVAFNHWRIACVTSGVVARAEAGALGTPLAELAALKASVVEHVAEAERMLDGSAPGGGT